VIRNENDDNKLSEVDNRVNSYTLRLKKKIPHRQLSLSKELKSFITVERHRRELDTIKLAYSMDI